MAKKKEVSNTTENAVIVMIIIMALTFAFAVIASMI